MTLTEATDTLDLWENHAIAGEVVVSGAGEFAVHPRDGGCWYCHKATGPINFSCEFDTYAHEDCIGRAVIADPGDLEAKIMWREIVGG